MLRTLDLFTGIGGITHALRGLAHPVAYCEKDEKCRAQLAALMKCGKIPTARVHEDVTALTAASVGGGKIDMIAAGSPCIGFSSAGLREGLSHPGSGLFRHIVRLAEDLKPAFLFLENVEGILANKDIEEVVKSIQGVGYNMWWVVMPAYAVGAPQKRSRWFCLAARADLTAKKRQVTVGEAYARFDWSREKVARMTGVIPDNVRRMKMLGNSVVPDCVRAAFLSLWTGCTTDIRTLLSASGQRGKSLPFTPPTPVGELSTGDSSAYACVVGTRSTKIMRIPRPVGMLAKPSLGLTLVPDSYKPTKNRESHTTSPLVLKPVQMNLWSTPRAGNGTYATHVLTERGCRDLGTQLRFEKRTPDSQRSGGTNPEWGEWLMGFPRGWTASTCKKTK